MHFISVVWYDYILLWFIPGCLAVWDFLLSAAKRRGGVEIIYIICYNILLPIVIS